MDMVDNIIRWLTGDTATALGTVSSIISLALTIVVYVNIKNIRQFYLFTARVPQLSEDIGLKSSLLCDYLNSFNGMTIEIRTLLAEVEILLTSLGNAVDKALKKQVLTLLKEVKAINSSRMENVHEQKRRLENVYVSLHKVSAACSAKHEDARWER